MSQVPDQLVHQTESMTLKQGAETESESNELERERVIRQAESFVKKAFFYHDPSHDWHHVHRVRLLSLSLSRSPCISQPVDTLVLELGALFHDLCDAKYSSTTLGGASNVLSVFFNDLNTSLLTREQIDTVYKIVDNVSWSKDQRRREARKRCLAVSESPRQEDLDLDCWIQQCHEFQCVSDADRLDAIGSIGIMRCAAFSTTKNRPLYIPPNNPQMDSRPPAEQSEGYNGSAIAHFYEKLVKIRGDRLYTQAARIEADRRQQLMESFLTELDIEWMMAYQGAELSRLE